MLGPEPLAARIREVGADVVICEADFCMGEVLELPLRAIGSTRGDPSNVDVAAATKRGIPVLHTPGRNADAVAELTVALLFAVTRKLIPADRDVRAGQIIREGALAYPRFRAWPLAGRTAGLVGLGRVGQAVKWRLEGLGMRVIAHDPFNDEAKHTLADVLNLSDVVSVHASPWPETIGMIGARGFSQMKDRAVFLNTARTGLHALLQNSNAVLTPHIGGATYDTEANHSQMIAEDLASLLSGATPRYIANPEVLA